MDANYVMDETLGNASYDITKLSIGQKKMESFLIGKVRDGKIVQWQIENVCPFENEGERFLIPKYLHTENVWPACGQ